MADNKISALPTTSALTLDDLLETEQPAQAAGTRSRKAPISQLLALIFDNDPTLAGDSTNKAATQQAVKEFVEDAIADAIAALAPPAAAVAMQFVADTSSTADSDPGTGKLRWNHATQGSATSLFLDDSSDDGVGLTSLWPALHAGGTIFLQHANDQDTWQIWEITGITDASGYAKLAVTNLVNGGSFANSDPILVTIDRAQAVAANAPVIVTTVSSNTITPSGATDLVRPAALAANLTIANPSTTPPDGWGMVLEFVDNGTTRTLTWNSDWASYMATLPTATTAGKVLRVGCEYNAAAAKMRCMFAQVQP